MASPYTRTYSSAQVAAEEIVLADHLNAEFTKIFTAVGTKGITATELGDGSVVVAKLGTAAVETVKIKDDNVTGAKLADDVADGSTLEVSSHTLQIKEDGVGEEQMKDGACWVEEASTAIIDNATFETALSCTGNNKYTDLDIATELSITVTEGMFVFLQVVCNTNSWLYIRPNGQTHDYDATGGSVAGDEIGWHQMWADKYIYIPMCTDSDGVIEVATYPGYNTSLWTITVMGYIK